MIFSYEQIILRRQPRLFSWVLPKSIREVGSQSENTRDQGGMFPQAADGVPDGAQCQKRGYKLDSNGSPEKGGRGKSAQIRYLVK